MASDLSFMEFVAGQFQYSGEITFKKMFGEYAIYADGKVFAFVCDNKLFIKPIEAARNYIKDVVEAEAYPGSKMYFLIEDKLEDVAWLSGLVTAMVPELPEPKPKKKKNVLS
ncbi:MAG: TfoX/Sxy family protein [Saprospiraceae bacterium]